MQLIDKCLNSEKKTSFCLYVSGLDSLLQHCEYWTTMSKIDSTDLVLIRAVKHREYIYNGDLSSLGKHKRKVFFETFAFTIAREQDRAITGT